MRYSQKLNKNIYFLNNSKYVILEAVSLKKKLVLFLAGFQCGSNKSAVINMY